MRRMLAIFALCLGAATSAQAQYGKNQVMWEKQVWQYYDSPHFVYYFPLDMTDADVVEYFTLLQEHMERTYEFLSVALKHDLSRKSIVIVTRTHSQFEALRIHGDPFMPTGVNAFAFQRGSKFLPGFDLILVIKADADMRDNFRTYSHELVHHFEFDMGGWSFLQRITGNESVPYWLMEGIAEYLSDVFMSPSGGLDLRAMIRRIAALNAKNTQFDGIPTLYQLQTARENGVDVYTFGPMALKFVEVRYGQEQLFVLLNALLKEKKHGFVALVANLSNGELDTPEAFDRAHRKYWESKFYEDAKGYAQAYDTNDNFVGRQIIKRAYPFSMAHPVPAPDGTAVAFFKADRKYMGLVPAVTPALPRDNPPFVPIEEQKKLWFFGPPTPVEAPEPKVLVKRFPPKPYEYLALGFEPSLDWWQDPTWAVASRDKWSRLRKFESDIIKETQTIIDTKDKNIRTAARVKLEDLRKSLAEAEKELKKEDKVKNVSRIAFFARKGRDNALFILDTITGKLIDIEVPYDQAFSPSFSPDGQQVYFSAAKGTRRHIYVVDVKTKKFRQVTPGSIYAQSPALSSDGTKLAYSEFDGHFKKLFLLDLATSQTTQLTFGRYNDESPSWSSDGTRIAFVSDEVKDTKNLYTLDLATNTVSQWTQLDGGVFAPQFMPEENDRLVYTAFEENQFEGRLFRGFKLFDIRLKEPVRTFTVQSTGESMQPGFDPAQAVSQGLDLRQFARPKKPPARWAWDGGDVILGANTYWGMFGSSRISAQNILADQMHVGLFAMYGDFKYFDYTYQNSSRRWIFAANANRTAFPLRWGLYNIEGQYPRYPEPNDKQDQFVLNSTFMRETSVTLSAAYPLTKWERVEVGSRFRTREFVLPYNVKPEEREDFVAQAHPLDVQFYDLFKSSSGQTTVGLIAALVRDTVISSYNSQGPLQGSAMRVQVEYGKGVNKSSSNYFTASTDMRKYKRLSDSSLLAFRAAGLYSTRTSGDFLLMGDVQVSGYPYGSIAGNQGYYLGSEVRFPVADVALFRAILIPVRGALFGEFVKIKFAGSDFPAREEWAFGFRLDVDPGVPLRFIFAKTKAAPESFQFSFNMGLNF